MERDKITEVLEDVGAVVLANACGPCIGQVWLDPLDQVLVYTLSGSGNARTQKKVQMVRVMYSSQIVILHYDSNSYLVQPVRDFLCSAS
jgi:aconitase A